MKRYVPVVTPAMPTAGDCSMPKSEKPTSTPTPSGQVAARCREKSPEAVAEALVASLLILTVPRLFAVPGVDGGHVGSIATVSASNHSCWLEQ